MRLRKSVCIAAMLLGYATVASAFDLKDKTFQTEGAGTVVFSHKIHLKKKNVKSVNIACKSCHNANLKSNVRYTMADMEKGKSCGICHNGKKAFAVEKCTACHKVRQITYHVKETGTTIFSHTKHLKTLDCKACHNKIFNAGPNKRLGMAQMEKGKSCGACHDGKRSFGIADCSSCHPTKETTFKISGAGNVTFSHRFHVEAYKCQDCHPHLYRPGSGNKPTTMKQMEAGKSCGACHDSKTAFTVKENCDKCHKV